MKKYHPKPSQAIITASRASAKAAQNEFDGKIRTARGQWTSRRRTAWEAKCAAERAAQEAYKAALRSADFDLEIATSRAKGDRSTARAMRIEIIERYRRGEDEDAAQADLLALIPKS
jgi:hypothetical protein